MSNWIRRRLTYANVMATVAAFIALGGTSYAALKLSGSDLAAHSLKARNYGANSVTGKAVKEKTLATVPRAKEAARLDGVTAERLLVRCPAGTLPIDDTCIETAPRAPLYFNAALHECASTENQSGPGRRLPTYQELTAALTHTSIALASGGELTAEVVASSTKPGQVEDLYVTNATGGVGLVPDNAEDPKSFRCVTDPRN